ncbi:MAG: septum site-determining protein MinC [Methylococcaceae bacterium]|nr:septum site-determining protein MinC [Methylococcaceae bacterium]
MSTDSKKTPYNPPVLEFKSSTFSVPVLVLTSNDLTLIDEQLQAKIQLAPEFFKNSPLILDLQELNKQSIDFEVEQLIGLIRNLGLLPVGVRGGNVQQNTQAVGLGLPVYSITSSAGLIESQKQKTIQPYPVVETSKESIGSENSSTTLITQPIRSGQRIYASGDLVVLAQVSAGAEIMAEGNIHVYSVLRGRALAGVQGNLEARIFCSDLQAELVSIAGTYKISEDLDETVRNKPVQVYLQNDNLIIKDIL